MRVLPETEPQARAAVVHTRPAAISFAEVLANGESVCGIGSGRAFGFAETGIMGAYRETSDTAEPSTLPTEAVQVTEVGEGRPHQPAQTMLQPSSRITAATAEEVRRPWTTKHADAEMQTELARPKDRLVGGQPVSVIAAKRELGAAQDKSQQFGALQTMTTAASRFSGKRRSGQEMSVYESDDGIFVSIATGTGCAKENTEIVAELHAVAQQFGVTLAQLKLEGAIVSSARLIRQRNA